MALRDDRTNQIRYQYSNGHTCRRCKAFAQSKTTTEIPFTPLGGARILRLSPVIPGSVVQIARVCPSVQAPRTVSLQHLLEPSIHRTHRLKSGGIWPVQC